MLPPLYICLLIYVFDADLDAQMLAGTAKGQRFKSHKVKVECRGAYRCVPSCVCRIRLIPYLLFRDAIAEMETDGEADGASAIKEHGEQPSDLPPGDNANIAVDPPDGEGDDKADRLIEPKVEGGEITV